MGRYNRCRCDSCAACELVRHYERVCLSTIVDVHARVRLHVSLCGHVGSLCVHMRVRARMRLYVRLCSLGVHTHTHACIHMQSSLHTQAYLLQ